jgi:hypothetical protein
MEGTMTKLAVCKLINLGPGPKKFELAVTVNKIPILSIKKYPRDLESLM